MINAQLATISALCQNPELAPEIRHLEPHEFTNTELKLAKVYKTVLELIDLKIVPEPVLVAQKADLSTKFIKKFFDNKDFELDNLPVYLEEIRTETIRNEVKKFGLEVAELADDKEVTPAQLIFDIRQRSNNLKTGASKNNLIENAKFGAVLNRYVAKVEAEKDLPLSERGIVTPFLDFTRDFGILPYGDYTILAADTGMGKTALAGDIILKALKDGKRVVSFILEMSEEQIAQRQVSKLAKLSMRELREMDFYKDPIQKDRFFDGISTLNNIGDKYHVFGTTVVQITEIIEIVRQIQSLVGKIDLITVDYLQLAHFEEFKHNRVLEVGFTSQALAGLAKETNAHVLCMAQLSRSLSNRADLRPRLSDLKDSSYIEQSADAVIFIYRDDYYDKNSETPNIAEISVAKGRNIGTGGFKLYFNGKYTTFSNLDKGATQHLF